MKLLKSKKDEIVFKYTTNDIFTITREGIIVSDIVAQTALDRLAVTVEEVPSEETTVEPEVIVEPKVAPSVEAVIDPAPIVEPEIPVETEEKIIS